MFSCVDLFKCSWELLTPKTHDIGHVQGGLLRLMYIYVTSLKHDKSSINVL